MAIVRPFRGIHYNTEKVRDLSDVITPPYDNIPAGEEKKYLERHPYNFAHVLLPKKAGDDYAESSEILQKWRGLNVLVEDPTPCFYLYRQIFTVEGKTHSRDTLMCTVGLADFSAAIVRPHENTYGQYKADRLQILRKTGHNLSHIFGMVRDPEGFLKNHYERFAFNSPLLQGKSDEGVEHFLWKMPADKATGITEFFSDRPVYIVDGHHRYESALAYAREVGAEGKWEDSAAHMLFCIANSYDPALVVFPTHRRLKGSLPQQLKRADIDRLFDLHPVTYAEVRTSLAKAKTPQFGLWFRGELFIATPKNWQSKDKEFGTALNRLSVVWSDRVFLKELCGVDDKNRSEKIAYDKDADALWSDRQQTEVILFHAPPAIDSIADVADDKGFMPQKSTYFYPKLAAGLIMRQVK